MENHDLTFDTFSKKDLDNLLMRVHAGTLDPKLLGKILSPDQWPSKIPSDFIKESALSPEAFSIDPGQTFAQSIPTLGDQAPLQNQNETATPAEEDSAPNEETVSQDPQTQESDTTNLENNQGSFYRETGVKLSDQFSGTSTSEVGKAFKISGEVEGLGDFDPPLKDFRLFEPETTLELDPTGTLLGPEENASPSNLTPGDVDNGGGDPDEQDPCHCHERYDWKNFIALAMASEEGLHTEAWAQAFDDGKGTVTVLDSVGKTASSSDGTSTKIYNTFESKGLTPDGDYLYTYDHYGVGAAIHKTGHVDAFRTFNQGAMEENDGTVTTYATSDNTIDARDGGDVNGFDSSYSYYGDCPGNSVESYNYSSQSAVSKNLGNQILIQDTSGNIAYANNDGTFEIHGGAENSLQISGEGKAEVYDYDDGWITNVDGHLETTYGAYGDFYEEVKIAKDGDAKLSQESDHSTFIDQDGGLTHQAYYSGDFSLNNAGEIWIDQSSGVEKSSTDSLTCDWDLQSIYHYTSGNLATDSESTGSFSQTNCNTSTIGADGLINSHDLFTGEMVINSSSASPCNYGSMSHYSEIGSYSAANSSESSFSMSHDSTISVSDSGGCLNGNETLTESFYLGSGYVVIQWVNDISVSETGQSTSYGGTVSIYDYASGTSISFNLYDDFGNHTFQGMTIDISDTPDGDYGYDYDHGGSFDLTDSLGDSINLDYGSLVTTDSTGIGSTFNTTISGTVTTGDSDYNMESNNVFGFNVDYAEGSKGGDTVSPHVITATLEQSSTVQEVHHTTVA